MLVTVGALCVVSSGDAHAEESYNVKVGPKEVRPSMRWILTVTGGTLPRPQSALVAEYEEGGW
jgi:hypothetical protein